MLRRAVTGDAAAIAATHVQCHAETYAPVFGAGYAAPDLAGRLALWTDILARPAILHVADMEGRIVGFGHAEGAEITTLYLRRSHHRRGLGRELLTLLLRDLAAAGHADARFNVLAANQPAIDFYLAQGARLVGTVMMDDALDHIYALSTAA